MSSAGPGTARLALNVFPGGFNWPVWTAEALGYFAAGGLEVDVTRTPGSVAQWTRLASGEAQIAITLLDNVIAYREGQGEADVVVDDAVALMAMDTRVLPALVTRPDVMSYADLRGQVLAVDAVATGYAMLLMTMLEHGGLHPGDYTLARFGGVSQRFAAMKRGEFAGSLFNSPFEGLLAGEGFNILDTAGSVTRRYQGQVVASRRAWAETNRPLVVSFLHAIRRAIGWLYDPANRLEAYAIYERNVPDAAPDDAATAYGVLFDERTGFPPDGQLEIEGVQGVLSMRQKHGRPAKRLGDASAYLDSSFRDAVG